MEHDELTTLVLAALREGHVVVEVPEELVVELGPRRLRQQWIPKRQDQPPVCGESWKVSDRRVELWCLLSQGHMHWGEPHGWSIRTWKQTLTPDQAGEVRALRDADRLHQVPVEALIASIRHLAEMLVGPKS